MNYDSDSPEDQARRGLERLGPTSLRPRPSTPPRPANASHPYAQRRRFVRDGEVPVTVINREHRQEHGEETNQLEAAREAIRALSVERERAERSLAEAEVRIRDLETKLAHERIATDEAMQRIRSEKEAVEEALRSVQKDVAELRRDRQEVERTLAEAAQARQRVEERLRHAISLEQGEEMPNAFRRRGRPAKKAVPLDANASVDSGRSAEAHVGKAQQAKQDRRRGRLVEVREPESDIVEWWKPGWREQ